MIPDEILGVYHRDKKQFVSILKAAVMTESRFNSLPELLDIFEGEAVKFLEIFSGRSIAVPPLRDLVEKMQKVSVWMAMASARRHKKDYETSVDIVATRLKIKKADVRHIDEAMTTLMNHLSMELRPTNGEEEEESNQA